MAGSYSSRIDTGLSIKSTVTDPKLFPAFQALHNAVHILNASFDQTVDIISPPKASDSNSVSFSFRMQSFWIDIPEGENIEEGKPVTLKGDGFHVGAYGVSLGEGNPLVTLPYAWVLDVQEEDSIALVGWPPAIVDVEQVNVGDVLYAREDTGVFLLKNLAGGLPGKSDAEEGGDKFHPIGYGIRPGQLMLIQNLVRHKLFKT